MNILMMTNTYLPHVGGVAGSVARFTQAFQDMGHQVLVVAPTDEDQPTEETGVIRVPAIQEFNGSDFSVVLPIPGFLHETLRSFEPHVVHAHHPFLIGSTALRVAREYAILPVYTYHTQYEYYTHYVPVEVPHMQDFVIHLSAGFAELADGVIAPSESIADLLKQREVRTPIQVVPTGIFPAPFQAGDGARASRIGDTGSRTRGGACRTPGAGKESDVSGSGRVEGTSKATRGRFSYGGTRTLCRTDSGIFVSPGAQSPCLHARFSHRSQLGRRLSCHESFCVCVEN